MWRGLDQLAAEHGKTMRIHLAGGEPFGDWPRLVSIIRAARDAGLTPLEKVETNAFWATDDDLTRARLELLDALGMEMLVVSTDVYHQEFIPFERVERCVRVARRVLGRGRVRVRWWDCLQRPTDLRRKSAAQKREAYRHALEHHADRMSGRAADELAELLPRQPAAHFRDQTCGRELLESRHVHIDPYGNVFPGVCSGIILGNALRQTVPDLWRRLAAGWREHPVVSACVTGGSYELMRRAAPLGYQQLPGGYADKCHLCTHVRQFLLERGGWESYVGPPDCYADLDAGKQRSETNQCPTAVG
jgi:hypothetical protein